jgi:hypothetical protein
MIEARMRKHLSRPEKGTRNDFAPTSLPPSSPFANVTPGTPQPFVHYPALFGQTA